MRGALKPTPGRYHRLSVPLHRTTPRPLDRHLPLQGPGILTQPRTVPAARSRAVRRWTEHLCLRRQQSVERHRSDGDGVLSAGFEAGWLRGR